MGELQLEIVRDRMRVEYKVEGEENKVSIAYREVVVEGARRREEERGTIGGREQRIVLEVEVVPVEPGREEVAVARSREAQDSVNKLWQSEKAVRQVLGYFTITPMHQPYQYTSTPVHQYTRYTSTIFKYLFNPPTTQILRGLRAGVEEGPLIGSPVTGCTILLHHATIDRGTQVRLSEVLKVHASKHFESAKGGCTRVLPPRGSK